MGSPSSVRGEPKIAAPAGEMEISITAAQVIRPRYPTPSHLRNFEFSLLDRQNAPWLYSNFLLIYAANTSSLSIAEKVRSLKESLSDTLVLYYPLAGKIKDIATVECNDDGAAFIEARVDTPLSYFLRKPTADFLHRLMPFNDANTMREFANFTLLIQVTVFHCGGLALASCPSHRLMDASSMCTFLRTWAKLTTSPCNNSIRNTVTPPHFLGPSIIPAIKDLPDRPFVHYHPDYEKFSSRRFIFSGSNLMSLKEKCGSTDSLGHKRPTRVEVVQALIVKCAIRATSLLHPGPSFVFQTLNLRNRINPPVGADAVGNLIWTPSLLFEEGEMELNQILATLRRGLKTFCDKKSGRFNPKEGFGVVSEELKEKQELLGRAGPNFYGFSSLCRFPFYEIDFGWSRPAWITNVPIFENMCFMVDSRTGDGIEAWMTMEKEVMASLESDEEFLAYASIDTPVDIGHSRL
ncbi:hypothetical protein MLD38_014854 [Melastoma candidum]|uniref:Uncharacterized protein n=1 Tax=Melastoma candidum TaxID=119954 RepID=A0ACB9RML3_9MYRT|nr:hypothetical protein MLD38_014854 [Melastoma candidum]